MLNNEAPSQEQHANVNTQNFVGAKTERVRTFKCEANAKKNKRFVLKALLNIDVLIEFFGTITQCHPKNIWNHNTMPPRKYYFQQFTL